MITDVAAEFFEEVYDGPKHSYTWFIGNDPNSGLLGTLNKLNAAEASTSLVEGGTTIAAHVEHLRWSLEKANGLMRGEKPEMVWPESWRIRVVDKASWGKLINQFREEYSSAVEKIKNAKWESEEQVLEVLALAPHAAYHLGAIRQMVLVIKKRL